MTGGAEQFPNLPRGISEGYYRKGGVYFGSVQKLIS